MEEPPLKEISALSGMTGSRVAVHGHAHAVRRLGALVFVVIRDASGLLQAVIEEPSLVAVARQIALETPLIASGILVKQGNGASGVELQVESITPLSSSEGNLPVEISKESKLAALSLPAMFDYRPLTLRAPSTRSIFEIEAEICAGFREFLSSPPDGRRFLEINSPKLVSTGTEGGAQLFKLEYFGQTAYLAQSPQFYKQIMVGVFERVFEIGAVYRAEEHDTSRHINEYVSMDVEMGFIAGQHEVMRALEGVIGHIIARLSLTSAAQLQLLGASLPQIKPFSVVSLEEALTILREKMAWNGESAGDLDPSGERLLCQYFTESEGSEFVFVTGYSQSVRPFYAMPVKGTESTRSFDLLFRGVEISTGGQRIHEYKELAQSIKRRGMAIDSFADYLQCFQYGMPPHGGFAIGLERFTQQLLGLPSVKLASLFPRDRNRLSP
jgi:nondiscriminating aspartyl-tRNA synthetase